MADKVLSPAPEHRMEPRRARGNVSQMMEAAGTRARARVRAQWEARVRRAITTTHRIAALAATGWPTSAAVAGCDLTAQPCVFSITCQQVGGGAPSVRRLQTRRGEASSDEYPPVHPDPCAADRRRERHRGHHVEHVLVLFESAPQLWRT